MSDETQDDRWHIPRDNMTQEEWDNVVAEVQARHAPVAGPADAPDAVDEAFEASLPPDRQFARRDARRMIAELSRPADAVRPSDDELTHAESVWIAAYDVDILGRRDALRRVLENFVAVRAESAARASVEAQEERDRLARALRDVEAEVVRQMERGEQYEYRTDSEPIGVRGGSYTSRRGDLCNVRDAVERIVRAAFRSTRSGLPHAATKPAPENA